MRNANRTGIIVLLAAGVVLILALQGSGSSFFQGIFINICMYIILVVSLNLSNGFTGVFSLGHIGFMALGAYISAILTLPLDKKASLLPKLPPGLGAIHLDMMIGSFPLGFLLATLIAGVLVMLVAVIVGAVLMRLSGILSPSPRSDF
jgi:branched-chain amino acid transport system permease protein